jgi:hypothetical protein
MNATRAVTGLTLGTERNTPGMKTNETIPNPADRRGHGFGVTWWLFSLLAAYLLSTGPVFKLEQQGLINSRFVKNFYAPLGGAMEHCGPLSDAMIWYVSDFWHNTFPPIH